LDRLAQLTGGPTTAAGAAAAAQEAATAAFMNISGRIRAGVGGGGSGGAGAPLVPPPPEKDNKTVPADVPTEEDGKLSIDVAEKLLSWHAEAVGRCVELSVPTDL
jgi:hypothetical protein